jgi:hypothetical protein
VKPLRWAPTAISGLQRPSGHPTAVARPAGSRRSGTASPVPSAMSHKAAPSTIGASGSTVSPAEPVRAPLSASIRICDDRADGDQVRTGSTPLLAVSDTRQPHSVAAFDAVQPEESPVRVPRGAWGRGCKWRGLGTPGKRRPVSPATGTVGVVDEAFGDVAGSPRLRLPPILTNRGAMATIA